MYSLLVIEINETHLFDKITFEHRIFINGSVLTARDIDMKKKKNLYINTRRTYSEITESIHFLVLITHTLQRTMLVLNESGEWAMFVLKFQEKKLFL